MKLPFPQLVLAAACAAGVLPSVASAQSERQRRAARPEATASPKQQKEASKKASAAARVFDQIMDAPDNSIPKELLDRAEAVAVFPGVLKAGFVVGGRRGPGPLRPRGTG